MKIPAPAGYDAFLRTQYGDYMTPAQEPTNHGTTIFDTHRSYKEVLPEVRQEYRRSALKRLFGKILKSK